MILVTCAPGHHVLSKLYGYRRKGATVEKHDLSRLGEFWHENDSCLDLVVSLALHEARLELWLIANKVDMRCPCEYEWVSILKRVAD